MDRKKLSSNFAALTELHTVFIQHKRVCLKDTSSDQRTTRAEERIPMDSVNLSYRSAYDASLNLSLP